MTESSTLDRAKRNATGIVSTVVTGSWLAAMFLGYDWWLGFMLFGYVVLVPVTALLFGDEEAIDEWIDGEAWTGESASTDDSASEPTAADNAEALERLRARYAEGELTDAQFERKLDRLLETETLEDAEEWRERTLERDRE